MEKPTFVLTDAIKKNLCENFKKCVKGFHVIQEQPIKEKDWEIVNGMIFNKAGDIIQSQSNGSHRSGADIISLNGSFSNKTCKYENEKSKFQISSYRLTTVCSDKNPGQVESIVHEINRRKNFDYYSVLVREENAGIFSYDWYLLPSDLPQLEPSQYQWSPKVGKNGAKKGIVTGWETNQLNGSKMSITFSMSSQLWIDIKVTEDMEHFKIASSSVNNKPIIDYISLLDLVAKMEIEEKTAQKEDI
jgi:hypothetical protein